jgi:hypothetical protein
MSQLGIGVVPAAGAVASELTALTRRGVIPSMVVQIYQSRPLLACLMANSNTASGGISPITRPVQGSPYVQGGWTGYNGSFQQPAQKTGAQNVEFNLKAHTVPIPFLGMESLVQMGHEIVPIIEARMADAQQQIESDFVTALIGNTGGANANQMQLGSIMDYADDGTNAAVYGAINRGTAANAFWKGYYTSYAIQTTPTRQQLMIMIAGATKFAGGESPNIGFCGFGTWTKLAGDFLGNERYDVVSGFSMGQVETGFRSLMVSGVPIFADPAMPEGEFLFWNTKYLGLYFHEAASFAFSGFESTIPNNQIGYQGVVLTLVELVGVKSRTAAHFKNMTYESI